MSSVDIGIYKFSLKKLWTKYRIVKAHGTMTERRITARKIRILQARIGYTMSDFPELK